MSETVRPSVVDPEGLIARIRDNDETARQQAYHIAFGGVVGMFVLGDILNRAGLASPGRRKLGADERAYNDGRTDLALEIAGYAGHDAASVSVMALSGILGGREDHEREPRHYDDDDAGPGHRAGGYADRNAIIDDD